MSELLLVAAIGAGALTAVSIALVAVLSLRALGRGAELEAEMKALSFAFRLHLQPHGRLRSDGEAYATAAGSVSKRPLRP